MIRLRITFLRDGEIQHHKGSQHASYALAKAYWLNNVANYGLRYVLFGAFWRGRKCLSFKVS